MEVSRTKRLRAFSPYSVGPAHVHYFEYCCQPPRPDRLYVQGNYYWLLLYVMNVGGSGDIGDLAVKRAGEPDCSYVPASRNWGITYQVFAALGNAKGLVVRMTPATARRGRPSSSTTPSPPGGPLDSPTRDPTTSIDYHTPSSFMYHHRLIVDPRRWIDMRHDPYTSISVVFRFRMLAFILGSYFIARIYLWC